MLHDFFPKLYRTLQWLPAYGLQRLTRSSLPLRGVDLVIALADHFEPAHVPGRPREQQPLEVQEQRVERWCRLYPAVFDRWRDAQGYPFRHTYFYPAEQYAEAPLERLVEHCHSGWGEMEIHLHHGVDRPDTPSETRRVLEQFRDILVDHGCLSRWDGEGSPRYAFVHGNWALANSGDGRYCGVDEEMKILAETGCYADFTLPSAPDPSQIAKINALYQCSIPLDRQAPHRRGVDLRRGQAPTVFPLIIQGPLGLNFARRVYGFPIPNIENGSLTTAYPPTLERLRLWARTAITVKDQPSWIFVKLYCHGMNAVEDPVMLGRPIERFLDTLTNWATAQEVRLHFVTAREMVNIILAACDGHDGNAGAFRNHRLRLIREACFPALF